MYEESMSSQRQVLREKEELECELSKARSNVLVRSETSSEKSDENISVFLGQVVVSFKTQTNI